MERNITISRIYLSPILIILLTLSCRTSKHSLEEQKATQQVHRSESQEWQQYLQQDSTIRYWHFASDSIFYFHPGRGLWGQGGTLYYEEQSAHTHELETNISVSDSTVIQQHSSKTEQKTMRKKQLPWYIYLIMLLGLGSLAIYYLRRKGL